MDKHQRKQIAKWEAKKAKDQRKFDEYMREHSQQRAMEHVERVVREWEPCPNVVFAKARTLLKDIPRRYVMDIADERVFEFLDRYRLVTSKRCRVFLTELDIAAEIAEEKCWKQEAQAHRVLHTLCRHSWRVNAIREELLDKTHRLRTIQNCLLVKEELMMNVWHPRRMEQFLETYGWKAYENLLGVE